MEQRTTRCESNRIHRPARDAPLQFRAHIETRPTQAYDLTVMIEWS
jgi:hypothetical protein